MIMSMHANVLKKSFVFGDNIAVVNGSTTPHAKIHKRHVALSFHRVREAIASKIVSYHFIKGEINPADILSKHWGHSKIWPTLKPFLGWNFTPKNLLWHFKQSATFKLSVSQILVPSIISPLSFK